VSFKSILPLRVTQLKLELISTRLTLMPKDHLLQLLLKLLPQKPQKLKPPLLLPLKPLNRLHQNLQLQQLHLLHHHPEENL
jgi:hypothetical protein